MGSRRQKAFDWLPCSFERRPIHTIQPGWIKCNHFFEICLKRTLISRNYQRHPKRELEILYFERNYFHLDGSGIFTGNVNITEQFNIHIIFFQLVSGSNDKNIKLWTFERRRFLKSFTGHTNWVSCVKFSQDGNILVSCSDDKSIKMWDVTSGECITTFTASKGWLGLIPFNLN